MKTIGEVEKLEEVVWQAKGSMNVGAVNSIYCFGAESTVRGFFPLTQNKVLDFYIELEGLDEHKAIGECCIMMLEDYLRNDQDETIAKYEEFYKKAKKLDLNLFIKNNSFDKTFQLNQIGNKRFKIKGADLIIDFFEGVLDGNMDAVLKTDQRDKVLGQ